MALPFYFFAANTPKSDAPTGEKNHGPMIAAGIWLGFIGIIYASLHAAVRDDVSLIVAKILEDNDIAGYDVDFVSVPYSNVNNPNYTGNAVLSRGGQIFRIEFNVVGESAFSDWIVEIPGPEMMKLRLN